MDLLLHASSDEGPTGSQTQPVFIGKADARRHDTASNLAEASFEQVLDILKNEPDYDTLISALQHVRRARASSSKPMVPSVPGPQYSQLVQVLVLRIAPNYWPLLKTEPSAKGLFLDCLRSLTGVNACLARLRVLLQDERAEGPRPSGSDPSFDLDSLLDMTSGILEGEDGLHRLWIGSSVGFETESRKRPLQQEFVNIVGGGKIISLAAEAQNVLDKKATRDSTTSSSSYWIANGKQYSIWLAMNLSYSANRSLPEGESLLPQLLAKSFRLGYQGMMDISALTRHD